ncbi:MAG TPA: MFS transporter [Acetobacteraceae bacterium]|nr:MFS transporter [Acetobacteraceae bacterium]
MIPDGAPPATDARQPFHTRLAVIAVAAMFGLTYSLAAPLIALRLAASGLDDAWVGANAAMHAVGVLLIAPVLPLLVVRFGMRRLVLAALLLAALVLAAFAADPPVWLWFVLRLMLGIASETLFVLSETWTSQLAGEASRARIMASYMTAMSLGFAAGPLLLSVTGTQGALPFLAGAVPLLVAMAVIAAPGLAAPPVAAPGKGGLFRAFGLAPLALAATVVNAAVEAAGLSFLALYAIGLGWPQGRATGLVSTMMVGAIGLQLPIGWLGDRMDRLRLVALLALTSAVGALLWPLVLAHRWASFALVFVWGGVFVGIYTVMLTIVGSRFRGADLVGIYAAMGLTWGVGALLGPTIAGFAMEALPHGLPLFVAVACLGFLAFVMLRRRRLAPA